MVETKSRQDQRHISVRKDGEREFVMRAEGSDIFVRTGRQVIDACRLDISIELWIEEFRSMIQKTGEWSEERSGQIRSCYCAPRNSRLVIFFCPASDKFDFDLADDLAQLNITLRQLFNIGPVDIQQIPWDEAPRFLHPETARWIYGQELTSASASVDT